MRPIAPLVAVLLLAACADPPSGPSTPAAGARSSASASEGFIVVLGDGADARAVAASAGVNPRFVYTRAINGFAGTLNAGQLTALRHAPRVEYLEPDAPVRLFTTQLSPPSWGLDRIDQRDLPLNASFTYGSTGKGVIAYVLDTRGSTASTRTCIPAPATFPTARMATSWETATAAPKTATATAATWREPSAAAATVSPRTCRSSPGGW